MGLDDGTTAEDSIDELAGAELSMLEIGVSEVITVEASEVGTSDDEIVEEASTEVEDGGTVSEGTAFSADDAIEDLAELACVLHRLFFARQLTK